MTAELKLIAGFCILHSAFCLSVLAQGTAFTYQGRLNSGGTAANGSYDLSFTQYTNSSSGSAVVGPVTNLSVSVTNGLFSTSVDFGNAFTGESNWLQIAVSPSGSNTFMTLFPRQQLTPAPYAVFAESANAANLVGTVPPANLPGVASLAGGNAFTGDQSIISGNVGIGTMAPTSALQVFGTVTATTFSGSGSALKNLDASQLTGTVADARLSTNVALQAGGNTFNGDQYFTNGRLYLDNNQKIMALNSVGTYETFLLPRSSNDLTFLNYGGGGFNLRNNSGVSSMFITGGGEVGIGTTNPANSLDVQGSADFSGNVGIGTTTPTQASLVVASFQNTNSAGGQFGVLNNSAGAYVQTGIGPTAVSIYAADAIWSGTVCLASSDERIKSIQGVSDGAADLKTLLGIRITDYTFRDTLTKGSTPQKKVIAQQVEKVFPQAVSQHTDVVPDLYRKADTKDGWVQLATDLMVGERIKLIGEKEQGVYPVLEVRNSAFRTDFKPASGKVFVYGREVNDFRTVDYDAISMLNVSATQELAKKLAAKDEEISTLQAQVSQLEQKLDNVQKLVAQLAAESRNAKPAANSAPQPSVAASVRPSLQPRVCKIE